jgi:hypothetical protein
MGFELHHNLVFLCNQLEELSPCFCSYECTSGWLSVLRNWIEWALEYVYWCHDYRETVPQRFYKFAPLVVASLNIGSRIQQESSIMYTQGYLEEEEATSAK